ncbi:MAG TPA: hypothetical protein VFO41_13085, partial [Alphaproteobacteria bacterium]|nr:hypothetical protein [Alphaproteobacteria bacterium]
LLIAGIVAFLAVIGVWAFSITSDIEAGIGHGGVALGIAAIIIAGLIAGFLWLGRRGRRR